MDPKHRPIAQRVAAYMKTLDTGVSTQHLVELSGVDRQAVLHVFVGRQLVLWAQLRALVLTLDGDVHQAARLVRPAGDPYGWPVLPTFQLVPLDVAETLDVFGPAGINRPECFTCSKPGLALRKPSGRVGIYCAGDAAAINEQILRAG